MKEHPEFKLIRCGLLTVQCCSRLSPEETERRVNEEFPTGIRSQWKLAEESQLPSGETNPCQCQDDARNKHYTFVC